MAAVDCSAPYCTGERSQRGSDRSDAHRCREPSSATVAPGTPLRDGLERILRGRTGALIVLGYDRTVESLCTGGFVLDVEFSATRLRELCKMDGAIVLDRDATRILRAAVQLMPGPVHPHRGDRHPAPHRRAGRASRPASRSSRVSQSMHIIALYVDGRRYVLEDSGGDPVPRQPGARHPRALQAAPRRGGRHAVRAGDRGPRHGPRRRARSRSGWRWSAASPPRSTGYVVELGTDGRLLSLQLDELVAGVDADRELVVRDYLPPAPAARRKRRRRRRSPSSTRSAATDLLDLGRGRPGARLPGAAEALDARGQPARLPAAGQGAAAARRRSLDRLVDHFGDAAEAARGERRRPAGGRGRRRGRARTVREGLSRLAESRSSSGTSSVVSR